MKRYLIDDTSLVVTGRLLKTAKLQDEYYVVLEDPQQFVGKVRQAPVKADLFTFVQEIHEQAPRYQFFQQRDCLAVLPLSTYDHWLNKQITFKPRNKIRKAAKSGIEIRLTEFDDDLVRAIMQVYNENPMRQGQRNRHFGKDFATVRREHATFLDRSQFIGAFYQGQLIGFVKVTHVKDYSVLMNILAMISHRDKAPTNALLAKTVEVCATRNSRYLNYSTWGKREGLNEFKAAHGFQRFEIPRFFVPLTARGRLALKWSLHRKPAEYLPAAWVNLAATWRTRWYEFRFRHVAGAPQDRSSGSPAL